MTPSHSPTRPARRCAAASRYVAALLLLTCLVASSGAVAAQRESPARQRDEVLLISSRRIGTRCNAEAMAAGLRCWRYAADDASHPDSMRRWQPIDTADALPANGVMSTVVYVHGNRVTPGIASNHGLGVYHSLRTQLPADAPVRFIIWSWPSEQVRGIVKDYKVKAARTGPVGWQVAWAVNQLPSETPLALVGYSYGARVVTGSLHLLAGGRLNGRTLPDVQSARPPVHAILLAAALDADWLRPGSYHGRALENVDRLSLVTNRRDPAMKFYHLTTDRSTRALGYAGPAGLASIRRRFNVDVDAFDATTNVGRSHALQDYLASSPQISRAWHTLSDLAPPHRPGAPEVQMANHPGNEDSRQGG